MKGLPARSLHPLLQLLLLVALVVAGLCLGYFLALVFTLANFGLSVAEYKEAMAHPATHPQGWAVLMLLQGLSMAGVGTGVLLLPVLLRQSVGRYFAPRRLGEAWWLGAAALLMIGLLPALSVVVAWNAGVHFPTALHGFEVWARGLEDRAAELTQLLSQFSTLGRLLVGLLVIAAVPAVAEELIFRGVFQPNLQRWFGSRHVGIWLTAATFSAIHFQFFGFVPRFLLGLVLGYLYEWSGNILVPMAAHFTNNGFQLLLLYLAQSYRKLPATLNPDTNQASPWPWVLGSVLLSAALLVLLHRQMAAATPATETASE